MAESESIPPSRVLFVDLDITLDKHWLQHYRSKVKQLLESYQLHATSIKITPSKRKGLHARIFLDRKISAKLAVLLQFLLCDDHSRSAFNLARIATHYHGWNKLHETADWRNPHRHGCCSNKSSVRW